MVLFLLTLLGLVWNKTTTFAKPDAVIKFGRAIRQPGLLDWDQKLRTQHAQDYTNIRAPFGGNEQAIKDVADGRMIYNTPYQQSYQKNIRNLKILTEEARLGKSAELFTERNLYLNYHMPEVGFQKINEYWKSRERTRQNDNWNQS